MSLLRWDATLSVILSHVSVFTVRVCVGEASVSQTRQEESTPERIQIISPNQICSVSSPTYVYLELSCEDYRRFNVE